MPVKVKSEKEFEQVYEDRLASFEEISSQRESISAELSKENSKLLTKASLVFDLLKVSNLSILKLQEAELSSDSVNTDESSFLIYNCSRLKAILAKFEHGVEAGIQINFKNYI